MTKRAADRKRLITDVMAAFSAAGREVKGARICGNGDVILLTETPDGVLASNDDSNWVDLAGQTEAPSAGRT